MGNAIVVEKDIKNNPPLPKFLDKSYTITSLALIKKNYSITNAGSFKERPLQLAVKRGLLDVVKAMVSKGADVRERDTFGNTALHFACGYGQAAVANFLLGLEVDINARNDEFDAPLHVAIRKGDLECAKLLVGRGYNLFNFYNLF